MDPLDSGLWLTTSDGMIGKYCNSGNPTLIMANQQHDKFIVTKDLVLQPGDVIQFKVNQYLKVALLATSFNSVLYMYHHALNHLHINI